MRGALIFITGCSLLVLSGCAPKAKGPVIESYTPAYRQFPPEPVYSRVAWVYPPAPLKPKVRTEDVPMLEPSIVFDLPHSTVGEAIEALAQAIGYTWIYPPEAAKRPISIKMDAPVEEILREIGRQGGVYGVLDHAQRRIRVVSSALLGPEKAAEKNGGAS